MQEPDPARPAPATAALSASLLERLGGQPMGLGDLDAIRLLLRGNSVIDWHRVHFLSRAEVDRFLRLHLLDLRNPEDRARLQHVHREAVNYLIQHLGLQFPPELIDPDDVRDIFVLASQTGGFRRKQIHACVILKLMHVISHMDAAELRFQTSLSESAILELAEQRIVRAAARMREAGFPIAAFYGSRKTRNSIITKLLAKKENTAVTIFDKLRFRIVTEERAEVVPALGWLIRELVPFNFVIPGQSHNSLVPLEALLSATDPPARASDLHSVDAEREAGLDSNPFSGDSFRIINFIIDLPVRVPDAVHPAGAAGQLLGRTVLALVEFQVLDRETARCNEEGQNAHHFYKDRQRAIVETRLRKGGRHKPGRVTPAVG
ncbi:MAG: TIGR04552 family protein [Deltaproteobacteria bacterium]|nr:TIGR04552 family protein [Deltaproteobacteria bacterium]